MFDQEGEYAKRAGINAQFFPSGDQLDLQLEFLGGPLGTEAYLDYIQINAWQQLSYSGGQTGARHPESIDYNTVGFDWSFTQSPTILDITDQLRPQVLELVGNRVTTQGLKRVELWAFDPSAEMESPEFIEKIENQNLHGIDFMDMLVVYPQEFESEVMRFVAHRKDESGLEIVAIPVHQIYNEFAAGKKDPTAIRDFARMLHQRSLEFRYLMLFGDASFDYRYIIEDNPDEDFVPTYETDESLDPILSYPSDDYYGLLDEDEGERLEGISIWESGEFLSARWKKQKSSLIKSSVTTLIH